MTKRITSLVLCGILVVLLVSCDSGKTAQESEDSSSFNETESLTKNATGETGEHKYEKIFLDATEEDFEQLFKFYDNLLVCQYWKNGFDCQKSCFSYDVPVIKELIMNLYGVQDYIVGSELNFPMYYNGLIHYTDREGFGLSDEIQNNRKVVDPLFKFVGNYDNAEQLEWYDSVFYSADAVIFEWIETELFGGKPDRDNLVYDEGTRISCYYCDGRYYIQDPGGYGGENHNFKIAEKVQETDGRYTLDLNTKWGSETTWYKDVVRTVVGLIEKDGKRYWKIFSIDWD